MGPDWLRRERQDEGKGRVARNAGYGHGVGAGDGGRAPGWPVLEGRELGAQWEGRPGIESCLTWDREVLRGHFKKCVTINILCSALVTRLLVTNQRLSACQAPFPIIHMISKFSIICT